MAVKGPIYEEKGVIGNPELLSQLNAAFVELEEKMKALIPIKKGNFSGSRIVGYGVDKAQRGIAADAVISIARAIKSSKGW